MLNKLNQLYAKLVYEMNCNKCKDLEGDAECKCDDQTCKDLEGDAECKCDDQTCKDLEGDAECKDLDGTVECNGGRGKRTARR